MISGWLWLLILSWKSNGRVRFLPSLIGGLSVSFRSWMEKLMASSRKPSTPRSSQKRAAAIRAS